jgi:cytochrome c-type biogenesis protein CcmH/NrfF
MTKCHSPIASKLRAVEEKRLSSCALGGVFFLFANLKRIVILLFMSALAFHPLALPQTQYSARAKQIGMHLKCMCRGCDMSAGGCSHPGASFSGPCEMSAIPELREVDELLSQGKDEKQIMDAFVAKYGTVVLVEPPKTGFGLVAWVMPSVYLLLGTGFVILVISRWRLRNIALLSTHGASGSASVSPELLARARAQSAEDPKD